MDPYHIGNLDHELGDWLIQNTPDNGAASAQLGVINDFLGDDHHPVTHDDAHYLAAANGWWHPTDATGMQDAGHLLDAYGVPYHRVENATVDQVLGELKDGHRVIVGLRDDRLAPDSALSAFFHSFQERLGIDPHNFLPSRHAVAIKGVDKSDPDHPHILLYDPKQTNGPTLSYSLDAFTEAWKGSDFSFLATNTAPGVTQHQHEHHLVSDAAGLAAAALTLHGTGMPGMAVAAGKLVEEATDALWDSIMKSI